MNAIWQNTLLHLSIGLVLAMALFLYAFVNASRRYTLRIVLLLVAYCVLGCIVYSLAAWSGGRHLWANVLSAGIVAGLVCAFALLILCQKDTRGVLARIVKRTVVGWRLS